MRARLPPRRALAGSTRQERSDSTGGRRALAATDTQIQVQQTYERAYPAGALVFEEGDPGDCVFVIQSGEVELSRAGPTGLTVVSRLGAGEFFGEMSVIVGENRTARARAIADTRLLLVDGETLEAMCVERPEIAIRIIQRLTDRLIGAEKRLSSLGLDDWLRPLVRAIVDLAEPKCDTAAAQIPTTLRGLSEQAGLTMLEAHRALHHLLDRRLLCFVDEKLTAPDLPSVAACLESAPAKNLAN